MAGTDLISAWRLMRSGDLPVVDRIADEIHETLPEDPEVFMEKLALSPQTCFTRMAGDRIVGYAIAHPWMLGSIPRLDSMLVSLPPAPDCLYIHDIAVLRSARGGASAEIMCLMADAAASLGLPAQALVSVYGTDRLWARFGFMETSEPEIRSSLASYGASARYMVKR